MHTPTLSEFTPKYGSYFIRIEYEHILLDYVKFGTIRSIDSTLVDRYSTCYILGANTASGSSTLDVLGDSLLGREVFDHIISYLKFLEVAIR